MNALDHFIAGDINPALFFYNYIILILKPEICNVNVLYGF